MVAERNYIGMTTYMYIYIYISADYVKGLTQGLQSSTVLSFVDQVTIYINRTVENITKLQF